MNPVPSPMTANFISRGGEKLSAALQAFHIVVTDMICADLGSHVGGFVDCMLQSGARKVYSVDTSYGTLGWKLRKDPRVIVMERTNAMHVMLPELVDLVTVDVGWTPQARILPNVRRLVTDSGGVIALIKPQYEAPREWLVDGVLPDAAAQPILDYVSENATACGFKVWRIIESPLRGHEGNREFLFHLLPAQAQLSVESS